MKIRYNREIISGAIFVVLSAVLWFLIPVQVQTLEKTPINAQTFPRIAIGGMFLCSVGLLLEGIFVREKQELYVTKESFRSNAFKKELFRMPLQLLTLMMSEPLWCLSVLLLTGIFAQKELIMR